MGDQRRPRSRDHWREYKRGMKILQARLESWAEWHSKPIHGLGFPDQTSEYKLILYGAGASHSKIAQAKVLRYMPHLRDSEVDGHIKTMPDVWQRCIKARYLSSLNQKRAATSVGLRERKYAYLLRDAHTYLAAKLNIRLA